MQAIEGVLAQPEPLTPDLGGKATTEELGGDRRRAVMRSRTGGGYGPAAGPAATRSALLVVQDDVIDIGQDLRAIGGPLRLRAYGSRTADEQAQQRAGRE